MAPQKTAPEGGDTPGRQVNNILQNLRGEHFRHARNVQGKTVPINVLSSHAHNQPSLPVNLIYPTQSIPAPRPSAHIPGPSPPRSWRSHTTPTLTNLSSVKHPTDTPAWRAHALSLFFSTRSPASPTRTIFPDPNPIPTLTLLCLQLIRTTCPGADLADLAPYIPLHLRRALLRYAAVHAPLSQSELDAVCQDTAHVDTELLIIGPGNAFRRRRSQAISVPAHLDEPSDDDDASGAWDDVRLDEDEPAALRSLAVVSSPLSAVTVLAFPPTITHLALIDIPRRIALRRLPTICPLPFFLDLSYNTWLHADDRGGVSVLEEVKWSGLQKLEVLGLRGCHVTPKALLELNRGRWKEVSVIQ